MEEIAELLKSTREESGLELEEVSKDLNIDILVLKNIEDGHIGAFKDIFEIKNYILDYSKYLGLDSEKITNSFNEYLFEYTSKIPVQEIEKIIKKNNDTKKDEILSPYTMPKSKSNKMTYIFIYIMLLILVILAIFWSINQITIEKKNAYIISYRK